MRFFRIWITEGGGIGTDEGLFSTGVKHKRITDWEWVTAETIKDFVALRIKGLWTIMPYQRVLVIVPDIKMLSKKDLRFFGEDKCPTTTTEKSPD